MSFRPPILEYNIHHNVTNPNNFTVLIPTSMVIIYNATVGSVYNVQVQARNILGLGAIAQDTIS